MSLLHIFDVSGYNPDTIPACDAAIVKASEGKSYKSGSFAAQWKNAKAKKHRGAYHFARPEESSANSQADRFLDIVKPIAGESLWLDLETSDLSQKQTNDWAHAFGTRLRSQAPNVTIGVYLGSGYASNGTGSNLNQTFDFWWYPQYMSKYQTRYGAFAAENQIAINRSDYTARRQFISGAVRSWPSAITPWLPDGITTGWVNPHIWQFTDNFNGIDASVSSLTLDQLENGAKERTEDMMVCGRFTELAGEKHGFPFMTGAFTQIAFYNDNTFADAANGVTADPVAKLRVALLRADGSHQVAFVYVGRKDTTTKDIANYLKFTDAKHTRAVSITRCDATTHPIGYMLD